MLFKGKYLLWISAFLCIWSLALYFELSIVHGSSGRTAQREAFQKYQMLQKQLNLLKVKRKELENLTKRLSESYLDLDLLDERARFILGYAREDEILILSPQGNDYKPFVSTPLNRGEN